MHDQAVRPYFDHHGWHVLKEPDEFVQVAGEDVNHLQPRPRRRAPRHPPGDVIHDQANRAVFVDLGDVSGVDFSAANLFRGASGWALRCGVSFRLHGPPAPYCLPTEIGERPLNVAPVSANALRSGAL